MDPHIVQLGMNLFETAGRHTYGIITDKMTLAKEKKNSTEQQIIYEEIINDLMQDKNELEKYAQEYKRLYENLTISDEDIEHLQATLERIVDIIIDNGIVPPEKSVDTRTVIELFNKDTLKTAQLLGFNYKEAIGIPLTEVSSSFIRSNWLSEGKSSENRKKKSK